MSNHIISFSIDIGEERIRELVEKRAVEDVLKEVKDFNSRYYGGDQVKALYREEIKKLIEENKDEVLEKAIDIVAKNMMRTKAVKELLEEKVANGMLDE